MQQPTRISDIRPIAVPNRVVALPSLTQGLSLKDAAWDHIYKCGVRKPSFAIEVIQILDQDPEAKHEHLALYLMAWDTMKTESTTIAAEKERRDLQQARVRAVVSAVITTIRFVAQLPRLLTSLAAELTAALRPKAQAPVEVAKPKVKRTRARQRVAALRSDPELAPAIAGFEQEIAATSAGTTESAQPASSSQLAA